MQSHFLRSCINKEIEFLQKSSNPSITTYVSRLCVGTHIWSQLLESTC